MVNDMKRKVSKLTKRRLTVFGTLSLVAIIYFCFIFIFHMYTIYDLKKQNRDLEVKYEKLKTDAEDLQLEINKLNDPDYLARYAREKFSYSKDGEYIIKLNDMKADVSDSNEDLNTNYMILGFCGIIFIIFIYVFVKSKKTQ